MQLININELNAMSVSEDSTAPTSFLPSALPNESRVQQNVSTSTSAHAEQRAVATCGAGSMLCRKGVILPVWQPADVTLLEWPERVVRGVIYFSLLLYMFWGIAVVSERFMAAIDRICQSSVLSAACCTLCNIPH